MLSSAHAAAAGFVAFMRRPMPNATVDRARLSPIALGVWLLLFSFAAVAAAALVALPLLLASDAKPAAGLDALFAQPALRVIVVVVILGPLIEEMLFRGWLPGTRRTLLACALFLLTLYLGGWLVRQVVPSPGIGFQIGVAAIAFGIFLAARGRDTGTAPHWYRRAFPILFWAQGIIFGGLHFANVESASPYLPLVTTLPLITCGWLWGYARIVLGFRAAWALHMAYNVPSTLAVLMLGAS